MNKEVKKVMNGDIWAIDGDRAELDSLDIPYPITRGHGFGTPYSTIAAVDRERMNQIFCEIYSGLKACLKGIPEYDSSITYPGNSFVSVNGAIYHTFVEVTGVTPNPNGSTAWSLIGDRVAPPSSAPSKISTANIFVDGSRSDRFKVYWANPNDGGRPITQAKLRYSKDSSFSSGVQTINPYTQGSEVSIAGNDSDLFFVKVSVMNSVGWSIESDSKDVAANPLVPPFLSGFNISSGTVSGRVDLSWNAITPSNGLTISKYRVEWKSGSQNFSSSANPARHKDVTGTSTSITGLTNGTTYTFRVVVVSNRLTERTGAFTASASPSSGATAPAKPTINATGGFQSITAAATTIPADNGSPITQYDWQYKTTSTPTWTDANSTTTPILSLSGLAAGSYHVRMRAVNGVDDGSWSDNSNATVTSTSAPSNVTAIVKSGGSGKAVCSIGGDVNDGGSSITGFQWQYKLNNASNWTDVASSTNPTQVISDLTVDSTYEFRVKATNPVGTTTSGIQLFTIESNEISPKMTPDVNIRISRDNTYNQPVGTTGYQTLFWLPHSFITGKYRILELEVQGRKRSNSNYFGTGNWGDWGDWVSYTKEVGNNNEPLFVKVAHNAASPFSYNDLRGIFYQIQCEFRMRFRTSIDWSNWSHISRIGRTYGE